MGRPDYLILGRIVKVHGIRGEVKVALHADGWAPFQAISRCWVAPQGGAFRPAEIQRARDGGRAVVLKLTWIDSPEAAAALLGHDVAIPRVDAPPPPDGTFYHYDILGLEVVAGTRSLGSVREILDTPTHDVYVVRRNAGEWLLPALRAYIGRIDLPAGRIELDPTADWAGLVGDALVGEDGPEPV